MWDFLFLLFEGGRDVERCFFFPPPPPPPFLCQLGRQGMVEVFCGLQKKVIIIVGFTLNYKVTLMSYILWLFIRKKKKKIKTILRVNVKFIFFLSRGFDTRKILVSKNINFL